MFVGRDNEIKTLHNLRCSKKAELAIIYGRRRIGKSTLLEKISTDKNDFYFEAIKGLSKHRQIAHFLKQLHEITGKKVLPAQTWESAFDQLGSLITCNGTKINAA